MVNFKYFLFLSKMDKKRFGIKFFHVPGELLLLSSLCFVYSMLCFFSPLFTGSVTDKPPGAPNSGRKGELRSAVGCVCMRVSVSICMKETVQNVF